MGDTTDLYRYFDKDGNLLYVGISINAMLRLSQHRCTSSWYQEADKVKIEKFERRSDAIKAERKAIRDESPAHNIRHQKNAQEDELETIPLDKARTLDGRNLIKRVVHYKPMYKLGEAAEIIFNARSTARLKAKIESGEASAILVKEKMRTVAIGKNKGQQRIYREYVMTGWQVIEFIEALESGRAEY